MDIHSLVAIDMHTHAEVSSKVPDDPRWKEIEEASEQYFKDERPHMTIAEVAAYYRKREMAYVMCSCGVW
ncbi:MAG TPA: hypothetical protein VEH81_15555 [Ktedonobacteraceae bacterium]|nr:hypothetical protein [Ktedonobacteraceae bacterium]